MTIISIELNEIDDTDDLIVEFYTEYKNQCRLAKSKSGSGMDVLTLLVENSFEISSSLSLLIATLKAKKINFKYKDGGVEVEADASK